MAYVFTPPPAPSVAIDQSHNRFPVRRIFCVGLNYADHIAEMGGAGREPPVFFAKPQDAVVDDGARVPYPPACTDFHYEGELVVALGTGGANIAPEQALNHVWGYAAGIDLTRRDLQAAARNAGLPWDMAKGFDNSAPCGAIRPAADCADIATAQLQLAVNGEIRQDTGLDNMIWPVPDIISHLSALVSLAPGDLIYTGTPAGVGPLARGDRVTVTITGLPELTVTIT